MKTVLIEIPEKYDDVLAFTLVGGRGGRVNTFTHCVDLNKGRLLLLDKEKHKKGEVFYIQEE